MFKSNVKEYWIIMEIKRKREKRKKGKEFKNL